MSLDDDSDKKTATDIIALEWGRFEAADRDRDGTLSKEEFRAAIFPHEYSYMVDQMVNVSTPCFRIYTPKPYTPTHARHSFSTACMHRSNEILLELVLLKYYSVVQLKICIEFYAMQLYMLVVLFFQVV